MSSAAAKDPWSKFYWADWRSDEKLGVCSLAARGLWVELLALMHIADPYGHLLLRGKAPTDKQLGALCRCSPTEVRKFMRELEEAGVPTIEDGVWISRRLVRDADRRSVNRASGATGGNPKLGATYNRPGYVYIIGPRSDGTFKVGISTEPAKRLYKIRQQYPGEDLRVLVSIPTDDMGGAEADLHRRFDHCRKGEWFSLGQDDIRLMESEIVRLKAKSDTSPNGENDLRLKSHDARDPEARSQKLDREIQQPPNPSSESLRHGKAAAFSEDSRQCVADFDRLREEIFRHDQTMPADGLTLLAQATRWLAAGMSVEAMRDAVFEGMTWWAKKRPGAPSDFDAFKKSLTEIAAKRKAETEVTNGFVSGHRDAASWPAWAEDYRFRDKFWNDMRGEFPASMPPEWVAYALGKTDVRPDGKTGEAA